MSIGRARFNSTCPICRKIIRLGEVIDIDHDAGTPAVHRDCAREREWKHEAKEKAQAEKARRAAEQNAREILELAGECAGTWWDWGPLREAANLGFAAQWKDQRGYQHSLERYRLLDGAEAYVEQVTTVGGRRLDPVLYGPHRILVAAWAEHLEWLKSMDRPSLEHWLVQARSGANPGARPLLEYADVVLRQPAPEVVPRCPAPVAPPAPVADLVPEPDEVLPSEPTDPAPQGPAEDSPPAPPARRPLRREPAEPMRLPPADCEPIVGSQYMDAAIVALQPDPAPPPHPAPPPLPPPAPAPIVEPPAPPSPASIVVPIAQLAPMPAVDPLFAQRARKPASLGADVRIDLHRESGLLWVKLPKDADAARGALKGAGWYFHFGVGDQRCYKKCMACKAYLPDNVWFTRRTANAVAFVGYMTEEARQAVEGQRKAIEESRAADADIVLPAPEGMAYYPFQKAGVQWGLERESVLIADEMGLGKSAEALGIINADPTVHRTLVIAPANLVLNWRDEAHKWLVRPTHVAVLETPADLPPDDGKDWLLITNYEKLILQRGKGLADALTKRDWDCMVVDEAHRLANPDTAKSARAIVGSMPSVKMLGDDEAPSSEPREPGLIDLARRKIMLTGTPFRERVRDMYPILRTLDPVTFGSAPAFLMRYCDAKLESVAGRKRAWNTNGASNLDELQDKLRGEALGGRGLMIRRLKVDVLPELPAKRRMIVPLPVDGKVRDVLAREKIAGAVSLAQLEGLAAQADMCALRGLGDNYEEALQKLETAQETTLATFSRERHEAGLAKVPAAIDHISGMLDDGLEAIVVYAHHKDVVEALADGLSRFNAARYTGTETIAEKHAAVKAFQTPGSPCRVLVASIKAAREGITLTRAHVEAFVELSPSMTEMVQAEDRCHRIGQQTSVLVQHLVYDGSLDQRLCEILVTKMRTAEKALDSRPKPLPVKASYSDEVRRVVLEAVQAIDERKAWMAEWRGVGAWLGSLEHLTDAQAEIALRCLRYHVEQVPGHALSQLWLELLEPAVAPQPQEKAKGKKPSPRKPAKKPAKKPAPRKKGVPAGHT